MRSITLPLPVFGFVLATRAALAVGVGLLVANKLSRERRRVVGLSLVAFGAATTVPAARWIARSFRDLPGKSRFDPESRLIGA